MNNDFYHIDGDKDLLSAFLNQDSIPEGDMDPDQSPKHHMQNLNFLSAFDYDSNNGAVDLVYNQMKEKKLHQVTKFDEDDDKSSLKLAPDLKDIKAESDARNEAGDLSGKDRSNSEEENIIRINENMEVELQKDRSGMDTSQDADKEQNGMQASSDGEGDEEFKKPKTANSRKRGRQKKQKWTENTQARRERNRKSAQLSRLRKKNFVKCLEDKVADLEAEVKRQRIIIENQRNLSKLSHTSQVETMQQLLGERQMQYEKLLYLLENKSSFDDIENQIEALNIRHGSFGKERKIMLNKFFKNIIDNVLPNYAKYLIHAAANAEENAGEKVEKLKKFSKYQLTELMEKGGLDEWEEILGILNTTAEQRRQIMEMRKALQYSRIEFKEIVNELLEMKKKIFKHSGRFEKVMDEMRNILNPEQVGKFLVWLETKKNKDSLNSFDLWGITRIPLEKIRPKDEQIEIVTSDPSLAIPKSGKTKRKRSCKRKSKNLQALFGQGEGKEVQVFNDGGGLIDSEEEHDQPINLLSESNNIINLD
ncbi:unnamed protein product [Moneuplotes crassus]|uniref:BZIP domain-containing protein n=2 Tax=Euplotes crassus TaxID=5936 RepID=A0AAD1XV35_EUPCR|nr:unnamed protein product [Moneuplotes crassus]